MATMRDVAKAAGTSASVVCHVINDSRSVSAELRSRVERAMEQVGYHRPEGGGRPAARGRRLPEDAPIAFVNCNSRPSREQLEYPATIMSGCQAALRHRGRPMVAEAWSPADWVPGQLPSFLADRQIAAAIITGAVLLLPELLDGVRRARLPVVLADTDSRDPTFDQVWPDNVRLAARLTDHLLDLGHRNIAVVTGRMDHPTGPERLAGVHLACSRRGVTLSSKRILFTADFSPDEGARGVEQLLSRRVEFTALIMQSDLMASGAMRALRARGYAVPQDVSVVGFDNTSVAEHVQPSLTTVDVHCRRIGRLAAEMLLQRLNHPDHESRQALSDGELVIRSSTVRVGPAVAPLVPSAIARLDALASSTTVAALRGETP